MSYKISEYAFGRRRHLKDGTGKVLCGRWTKRDSLTSFTTEQASRLVSCKSCRKKLAERHPHLSR